MQCIDFLPVLVPLMPIVCLAMTTTWLTRVLLLGTQSHALFSSQHSVLPWLCLLRPLLYCTIIGE